MKLVTWNVNGIRAREADVAAFVQREKPDVLCLQELKAMPDQVPEALAAMPDYWCYWHGTKGYSGVSLHVSKVFAPDQPRFLHPEFDHETRIVIGDLGHLSVASIYVPNGGKDYASKVRFLRAMADYAQAARAIDRKLILCGDMNVARAEIDVHPSQRDARVVGQRPEERDLFASILTLGGLRDVGRELDPTNDRLYTWWAPWRNQRQRNIGWRLDYVLAPESLAAVARSHVSQRETGTSDHAPVIIDFELPGPHVSGTVSVQ
jgi:exodeoxyribonuclease-3